MSARWKHTEQQYYCEANKHIGMVYKIIIQRTEPSCNIFYSWLKVICNMSSKVLVNGYSYAYRSHLWEQNVEFKRQPWKLSLSKIIQASSVLQRRGSSFILLPIPHNSLCSPRKHTNLVCFSKTTSILCFLKWRKFMMALRMVRVLCFSGEIRPRSSSKKIVH